MILCGERNGRRERDEAPQKGPEVGAPTANAQSGKAATPSAKVRSAES